MLAVTLIISATVAANVAIHYECLQLLSKHLSGFNIPHRFRIVLGVLGALLAHAIEVWVFALVIYLMYSNGQWGTLEGNFGGSLLDCVYYSFTTFSTLGFGDIVPTGEIRFLTGIESLTGLVLITWTASFLYLEMEKEWG